MENLKFRAWDKTKNTWLHLEALENQIPLSENRKNKIWILDCGKSEDSEIILQQFTGLKDKNGKEIYEGDIVKRVADHPKNYFEVKWNNENAGFNISLARCGHKGFEIIGNKKEMN